MEKKDKKEKIWENYSIFSRYIREQIKKEEEKAKKEGKQLTAEQTKETRKKYTKQARIMGVKIIPAMLTAGIIGTSGYIAGKTVANQQQKKEGIERQEKDTKFTSDYKGNITIEGNTQTLTIEEGDFSKKRISEKDTWNSWKEDIKVDVVLPSDIAEKVELEISHLTTSEEILQYIKQQYVDEYNKNNEQKIETKNIQITKSNVGAVSAIQKNNKCMYMPNANTTNSGVYTIKHKGKILEHIARTLIVGNYKQAYTNIEEQKETDTDTENIYAVVAEGMDYCIGYESYEKGKTSKEVLSTYKNRLIKSVHQKEISNYQSLKEIKQTKQETGEELEL